MMGAMVATTCVPRITGGLPEPRPDYRLGKEFPQIVYAKGIPQQQQPKLATASIWFVFKKNSLVLNYQGPTAVVLYSMYVNGTSSVDLVE